MIIQLVFAVGVIALAGAVLYVGAGGATTVAGSIGSSLSGFVAGITATPTPVPTETPIDQPPSIESPTEPYTNQTSVDLVVTVPPELAGDPDRRIRVYLALEDQAPTPIQDSPLSPLPRMVIPVELTDGINDFAVSLVGPDGESDLSPVIRYVLDSKKPGIKLAAPRPGATINRKTVDVEGRSQGRSTLIARNATTGDSIVGTADVDGGFILRLPLAAGSNKLVITATDPAGNTNKTELEVTRGSGRLRASLSASLYSIKRSALPEPITLTVTVDDPDGRPVDGAAVTFTLSIPGIKTVTGEATTDKNGRAVFETTIPKGASTGSGSAGAFVRTSEFGRTTDETTIRIRK